MPKPYHTPKSERDEKIGALLEDEQTPCHRGEQIIAEMLSDLPERDFDAEKDDF